MSEHRSLLLNVTRADEDDNLVTFPLSSEEPYRRYDGVEILDHGEDSVDLTWLNSGNAPLLDTHSMYGLSDQLGVIRKAWIENKRIYVSVEFGRDQKSQDVAANVSAGIIRNVSVGYERIKIDEKNEETDEYRVSRWRPYEASFVPLPADRTVGMGRSAKPKEGNMSNTAENTALPPMTDEMRAQAIVDANAEITALAQTHNMSDIARSFINGAMAKGEIPNVKLFKGIAASQLPENTPLENNSVGLTDEEAQSFSLMRLAAHLDQPNDPSVREAAAFEIEASRAAGAARSGEICLPQDLMDNWGNFTVDGASIRGISDTQRRTEMTRAAVSAGGNPNVMTTAHFADRFIDNLREASVLGMIGATTMPGMTSDFEIPGGDTNISSAWLTAEDADVAESTPTFRKVEFSVKDLGVYTDLTRRFLMQTTIGGEAYVRMQILQAMALEASRAAFYGTGAGVPTGLANIAGIGSVTFAGAVPTRDELIDMNSAIAATNATSEPSSVMNTDMRGDLQKTKLDAGSGLFLMNGNSLNTGAVAGVSNQVADGDIFTGIWSDMVWALFGSLELGRSTEAKFLSGGIRLRAIQSMDFNVTRVGSFALGNDGA